MTRRTQRFLKRHRIPRVTSRNNPTASNSAKILARLRGPFILLDIDADIFLALPKNISSPDFSTDMCIDSRCSGMAPWPTESRSAAEKG